MVRVWQSGAFLRDSDAVKDVAALLEVRAALLGAAAPQAALAAAVGTGDGGRLATVLAPVVRQVQLGKPLAAVAAELRSGDPAADLLVRALAVVEGTGTGATTAVEQALAATREEAALQRMLAVRTVQAKGSAAVLTAVPVVCWLLLVAADSSALRFYGTPFGLVTLAAAVLLAGAGQWWSRRLVARAAHDAAQADPLRRSQPPLDLARVTVAAAPALLIGTIVAGIPAGVALASLAAVVARRRRRQAGPGAGGAAETAELLAVALAGGLSIRAAVAAAAPLVPPSAATAMRAADRRLAADWGPATAFAGTGLDVVGVALASSQRWGSPAEQVLRELADDLRADRRAAAEAATERTQLLLIFPTTLLTLPAFVLGVVPPLLWAALSG